MPSKQVLDARRLRVERYHQLRDAEEDFTEAKAAATSQDERDRLSAEFAPFRRAHREEDVRLGYRPAGGGISMRQNMWARWLEVADAHELDARRAFEAILAGNINELGSELRNSLVAITASAMAVEALYEDVVYLMPPRRKLNRADQQFSDLFTAAFGLAPEDAETLRADLGWLFARRNEAAHPYTEGGPPQRHPAGFDTGAELSRFNAVQSRRALQVLLRVLGQAEQPPLPANRWVRRWAQESATHHATIVQPIRARLANSPPDSAR